MRHSVNFVSDCGCRDSMDSSDISVRCQQALVGLLQNQPYASVRMADIAAAADTSRPTLYRYYHSKEQLFRAVVDSLFEQFYDQAEPYLTQFEESLTLVVNYLASSVAYQHRDLIRTLLDSGADDIFVSQMRKYFARLLGTLLRQKPEQKFRNQDIDLVTALLAGACFAALKEWHHNGMQQSPRQMAKVLAHLFNAQLLELLESTDEER